MFGDSARIRHDLEAAGITVLGNQVLQQDAFLLVGRNDDLDHDRPSVAQLLENHNTDQPVLLMDHRPTEVEAHATLPIDVQVSGHVHNGQIAPANLIVRTLYRLAYGYEEISGRHFFVTSGYGFWGIPLRLGSQSEVWVIDVKGR
jgi:phosphoesterase